MALVLVEARVMPKERAAEAEKMLKSAWLLRTALYTWPRLPRKITVTAHLSS